MRIFPLLFALFVAAAAILGGGGNLFAIQSGDVCPMFSDLDSGQKGYLNIHDFQRGWDGPLGYKNIGPYGNVLSGFSAADRNGDGRLTSGEYCAWEARK